MSLLFSPQMALVLVVSLLIYWRLPASGSLRLWFIVGSSLALLLTLHPLFISGAVIFASLTYYFASPKSPSGGQKLVTTILSAIFILVVGKYGHLLGARIFPRGDWVERWLVMPLGISYFAFRVIQFSADVYRGAIRKEGLGEYLGFLFFFPTFPAGPLDTYQGFHAHPKKTWDSWQFQAGIRRVLLGYFKKLVLVDLCAHFFFDGFSNRFLSGEYPQPGAALLFVGGNFLRAYLDLSAYTDIAIGLSALFGYSIKENFHLPFLSSDLGEFWRRWHVSLSEWCRDQVYFPLFGWLRRPWLAGYASMLVMGLWHQFSANWLIWALYHGSGLVVVAQWGRYQRRHLWARRLIPKPLGALFTLWFVALGYAFVATPDPRVAIEVLGSCFGLTNRSGADLSRLVHAVWSHSSSRSLI